MDLFGFSALKNGININFFFFPFFPDMQGVHGLFLLVSSLSLSLSLSLSHTCAHTATQTDTGICIVNLLTHSHTHDYPLLLIIGLFFWYLFFFFLYTVHLLIGSLIWQCPLRTMPILLLSELVSIWSQRRQIVVQ